MHLICEKHQDEVDSKNPHCGHPDEYCKFRKSCMISFMEKENKWELRKKKQDIEKMTELRFEKGGGLLPVIAQDYKSGEILMLAYINEEAWQKTLSTGKAHYWSRSRNKLWLKGESSNHVQLVKDILVDCDEDTVVYKVEQLGGAACHKGYRSCFFRRVDGDDFIIKDKPVFDPQEVYKK